MAADETISTVQTSTNAGRLLEDNDTWTITASGAINVPEFSALSEEVDGATINNYGSLTAVNPGPITAPPFATSAITILGDRNTINNFNIIRSSDFDGIAILGTGTTVINRGTIDAGYDGVYLIGANARVENHGTITSVADGVYTFGDNATVLNHGTITSSDDGIDVNGDGATVENHGTITATRDGIETNGTGVTILNSGTVIGASDSFDINGDNSSLTLVLGSNLQGDLSFDGANGTLNIGKGMNTDYQTDGGNPTTITAARDAFLQDGNKIYAINTDQSFAGLAHIADQTQSMLTMARRAGRTGQSTLATRGFGTRALGPWLEVSTDYGLALSNSTSAGFTTRSMQVSAGLELTDTLGLMVSGGIGEAKRSGSFETDTQTLSAGLYGAFPIEGGELSWGILAGRIDNTAQRFVQNNSVAGGFETATGLFDQRFIAPSLGFATHLQPGLMLDLDLSHALIETAAYSETGASNNASFSARSSYVTNLTSTLSWTTINSPIPFDMSAGLTVRHYGGDPLDVSIGAANGSFQDADSNLEVKAFISARMEQDLGNAWTLSSHANAGLSNLTHISLGASFALSKTF